MKMSDAVKNIKQTISFIKKNDPAQSTDVRD